jgi:hypothetical protein
MLIHEAKEEKDTVEMKRGIEAKSRTRSCYIFS